MSYGAAAVGIPPPLMRDMRKLQATATGVKAGGSSLTAKLAIGGPEAQDYDPIILLGNPPLEEIANRIWDYRTYRGQLAKMWVHARDELASVEVSRRWAHIRGPVGAAMLQLWSIGADWVKPFVIRLLDHPVSLLDVPPKQLMQIVKAQARRHLDRILLDRLCTQMNWDKQAVTMQYTHGIDWDIVRKSINGKFGNLSKAERAALRVVVCQGYWTSDRRWKTGMRGTGTCDGCHLEVGDAQHEFHNCGAVQADLILERASGRLAKRTSINDKAGWEPLLEAGLPPKIVGWSPVEMEFVQGALQQGHDGDTYGDGSGVHQHNREVRVATWSVLRLVPGRNDGHILEKLRGNVAGWCPTVPRAEMRALEEHLRHCGIDGTYIGDCKSVVEAARDGVPVSWTKSGNVNADLWQRIRTLQLDHGAPMKATKIAAHKSRSAMTALGREMDWLGNDAADAWAKDLAKSIAAQDQRLGDIEAHASNCNNTLEHIAYAAAWFMKKRPEEKTTMSKRKKEEEVQQYLHDITERRLGGWECTRCQRMALSRAGLKAISATPCSQVTQAHVHPSHIIDRLNGITWCTRCGAYALRWPRRLRQPCAGAPRSEAQANVRRRLMCGINPTTAAYLQDNSDMIKRRSSCIDDAAPGSTGREADQTGGPAVSARAGGGYRWCYPRLPGGPLAAAPNATAAARDGDEMNIEMTVNMRREINMEVTTRDTAMDDGRGPTAAPRRRIRAKSTPSVSGSTPSTPTAREGNSGYVNGPQDAGPRRLCEPHQDAPWSARLKCHFSTRPSPCGVCGHLTRTTCRGCERMICVTCARSRRRCNGDLVTTQI